MPGAAVNLVPPTKFAPPPAGAPSAEALMADVAGGDRAAFSRLYRDYAPRLKAYLMRGGLAAIVSAGSAWPRFAILLPLSAVAIDADSPGVLSRIDVVEPPYIAP